MSTNLFDECINIYKKHIYPVLSSDFGNSPIWPVIVVALIIYLLTSEINNQSCQGGDCGIYRDVKKHWKKDGHKSKGASDYIDKIIDRLNLNHNVTEWRRVLLISIILSLIILFLFHPVFPDGFDVFLVTSILFLILYPICNLFQYNSYQLNDTNNQEKLQYIRSQLKNIEIENNQDTDQDQDEGYSSILKHIEHII